MDDMDKAELLSYVVDNSVKEGHFDFVKDRAETWNSLKLSNKIPRLITDFIGIFKTVQNKRKNTADWEIKIQIDWRH